MIWGDTRGFPGERRREGRVVTGRPTGDDAVSLDTSVPHIARVYDYWLGGKDNFAADRVVAEQVIAALPEIRLSVRAQRAFLGRAVHYLARKGRPPTSTPTCATPARS